ncbi:MAG: helix-turn-helix domain-containing protein [Planctomycetaceae bacterium]|nr:helix-turn-helix domain-containing protein [Planctomycetaceae bacterium]
MHESTEVSRLLLTAEQAAEALTISPRKLWELTNTGQLPCVRIGRAVRYDRADLEAWIAAQKRSR